MTPCHTTQAEQQATATAPVLPKAKKNWLGSLEERIDDVLAMAKNLGREGLEEVILYLRRARNEVVWKKGR